MILSFHPIFESDTNRLCAGRLPDESDLAAIQAADAVILPQGCKPELYEMARQNCRHVFPDYHARFMYPGKIGQVRLFEKMNAPHPQTKVFQCVEEYRRRMLTGRKNDMPASPAVFKFNWGGEGDTVFLVQNSLELEEMIHRAESFETAGQTGFLLQEFIPCDHRVLRVVVIGTHFQSYWRVQDGGRHFPANLSAGARIDHDMQPDLQEKAVRAARKFCRQTRINLAGFDFLFSNDDSEKQPVFLEINYFFGRKGIGGSESYYTILHQEIRSWIDALPPSDRSEKRKDSTP